MFVSKVWSVSEENGVGEKGSGKGMWEKEENHTAWQLICAYVEENRTAHSQTGSNRESCVVDRVRWEKLHSDQGMLKKLLSALYEM